MENFIPMPVQKNVQAEPPSTTVNLYSGVPLDPTYQHVRGMLNQTQINAFLENYKVKTFANFSVINMGINQIDLPMNEYETLNCNYVSWKSPTFNNRWHYAFIVGAVRLSDRSCTIFLEKDVWNENQDLFALKPSLIERMIVPKSEDTIGAYTFPEGLETGDYVQGEYTTLPTPGADRQLKIWGLMNFKDVSYEPAEGAMINGVYQGLRLTQFSSAEAVNTFLSYATENNKQDGVLSIFMMSGMFQTQENLAYKKTQDFSIVFGAIDGYTPKNNKCYVYPYNFLVLDNNCGAQVELHFELFQNPSSPSIQYGIALNGGNPVLFAYPLNYEGLSTCYNSMVTFSNFPKCSYTTDYYKAWLAQNASSQNIRMGFGAFNAIKGIGQGIAQIGVAAATGGASMSSEAAAAQSAMSTGGGILNSISSLARDFLDVNNERRIAQLQPDATKQSASTGANGEIGNCYISVRWAHCRREYIEAIDNYFSAFGYHIGRIRTPDLTSRPSWNYVKCVDVNLGGIEEHDDLHKLKRIFKNGVTVWHTNDIGNYNLSN